ncbi:MAG: MBL fold metallo-hydrolase [Pseudomonadota bacterium]
MRVTLLGTGCPVAHPRRGGAATLIEGGGARVLVDCGSGVTQALVAAGCKGAEVDALVVTHLHSDHLVDFYQLVISSWHQGRDRPWVVHCPEPVIPVLEGMMAVWEDERALRISWEARSSTTGLELEIHPLTEGRAIELGGLTLDPVLVEHQPVEPAFGFVIRGDGHRAVLSGDTARCEALIAAGRGCDLLVHEVYLHREMGSKTGTRSAKTLERVASYHTLSSEVGAVATAMEAKALALTHFVPPVFDAPALIREVAASYAGPVLIGEDGMAIDLGGGTVAHGSVIARVLR